MTSLNYDVLKFVVLMMRLAAIVSKRESININLSSTYQGRRQVPWFGGANLAAIFQKKLLLV